MCVVPEQGTTCTDITDMVQVTVTPGVFAGEATLALSPGPVAGASAELRKAGISFWLTLREWLPGLIQSSNAATSQIGTQDLSKPITLTVTYTDNGTQHLNTSQLGVYHWDEVQQTWQLLPGSMDQINQVGAAQTQKLGDFSLQAPLLCPADNLDKLQSTGSSPFPSFPTPILQQTLRQAQGEPQDKFENAIAE